MKHPHGTFCWMDIYLPDPGRGKAFYGALFGWGSTDVPMGDSGMSYTKFDLHGKSVGGLGPEMPGMLPDGVPPHWFSYLAVGDLDGTTERARSLGANFLMGPTDVGNSRVALMQDPGGASLFLWQALQFGGAEIIRSPGALVWNELYTRDLESTKSFYSGLFGWDWTSMPIPQGGDYHLASREDFLVCGVLEMDEHWGEIPPHWMVYIQVEDADATAAKVTSLGGEVCVPVTDISVGRFAVVNDDQNGTFTIFEPATPPRTVHAAG